MVRHALVLLSGGLDSMACIYYYINQGFDVKASFIDYGQKAEKNEYLSASAISSYFGVSLEKLSFKSLNKFGLGEHKGRNAFLIFAAILSNPGVEGLISMGIHATTNYYDCSELFEKEINRLLCGYFDGTVIFSAPFIKWSKKMIYMYCKENCLPIDLTYSCEEGNDIPCGECCSCLDRRALNVR